MKPFFIVWTAVMLFLAGFIPLSLATATEPYVLAAGDIACKPGNISDPCKDADTAALLSDTAAVIPLGDNQYESGTLADFMAGYDTTWGAFKPNTYPVPGNHEYRTLGAVGYFDYFGAAAGDPSKGYYSYNVGEWHVVVLNSNCLTKASLGIGSGGCNNKSAQMAWLKADLAADTHTCELVAMHHPRFTSEAIGVKTKYYPFWKQAFVPRGVDVVLSGHAHNYERFPQLNADGVPSALGARQFVVGTGGKDHRVLTSIHPRAEVSNDETFGVLKLDLLPTSYAWEFIPIAGETFTDTGTTECH